MRGGTQQAAWRAVRAARPGPRCRGRGLIPRNGAKARARRPRPAADQPGPASPDPGRLPGGPGGNARTTSRFRASARERLDLRCSGSADLVRRLASVVQVKGLASARPRRGATPRGRRPRREFRRRPPRSVLADAIPGTSRLARAHRKTWRGQRPRMCSASFMGAQAAKPVPSGPKNGSAEITKRLLHALGKARPKGLDLGPRSVMSELAAVFVQVTRDPDARLLGTLTLACLKQRRPTAQRVLVRRRTLSAPDPLDHRRVGWRFDHPQMH